MLTCRYQTAAACRAYKAGNLLLRDTSHAGLVSISLPVRLAGLRRMRLNDSTDLMYQPIEHERMHYLRAKSWSGNYSGATKDPGS